MTEVAFPFTAYDVTVDRGSLAVWDLGRDGTGYAVQIAGEVDDRWTRCFYLSRLEMPSYSRFHLDREQKIIWFACRPGDRPAKLQPVVDSLARLLESVNKGAEAQAWDEWGER